MATKEDVQKLAALARVSVSDAELDAFTKEFDAILAYVGQLDSLDLPAANDRLVPPLYNVMRRDDEPHESGTYTEALASQFPSREGDALMVKQVIKHD